MYHISLHNPPINFPIISLYLAGVLILFSGCTEVSEFEKRQAWLKKNYPSRENNLQKLAVPTVYKKEILNGQAIIGMRWQEVLIAKIISPYGPKAGRAIYWQGNKLVPECIQHCKALLITKSTLYFFESTPEGLTLVRIATKTNWPRYQNYIPESYDQALSMFGSVQ